MENVGLAEMIAVDLSDMTGLRLLHRLTLSIIAQRPCKFVCTPDD